MRAHGEQRRVPRLVQEDRGWIAVYDPALRSDDLLGFRHGLLGLVLQELGGVGSRHSCVCRFGEVRRRYEKKASIRPLKPICLLYREQALRRTVDAADDAVEEARVGWPEGVQRWLSRRRCAYVRIGGRPARSSSKTVMGIPNPLI